MSSPITTLACVTRATMIRCGASRGREVEHHPRPSSPVRMSLTPPLPSSPPYPHPRLCPHDLPSLFIPPSPLSLEGAGHAREWRVALWQHTEVQLSLCDRG